MNRRQAMATAVGFSIGLAGCGESQSGDGGVSLTVFNQADAPYTVECEFFGDDDTEGAARAYSTTLDIEPDGQATSQADIEPGRYLVRYAAYEDNAVLTDQDHVHYIPAGDGVASLSFDIQETGELTRR